jgi:hypothetical protein
VSFDIFFQRFENGEAARGDASVALAVLEPLVRERAEGWARIVTADGEADVYMSDPASGLMVNHASGRDVWDVMFELARATGFVVMPIGCGTCVVDESSKADLPDGVPEPIVLIASGADLRAAVERP